MRVRVPAGACDTHMHFYDAKRPAAPGTFLPGDFSVTDTATTTQSPYRQ